MKIKAQISMVLNLDKCIGCHTCSVTCKNTWTNRPGAEYMWFNNVETKPGVGYPQNWEDNQRYKGGWKLDSKGKLTLKAGGKLEKFATLSIFYNQNMPELDDYYEPWTYDYQALFGKEGTHQPVARAKSQLTGENIELKWGPNWDDDLAGGEKSMAEDPNLRGIQEEIKADFESVFMMYLPRLCEHCLNPACVASCPSGAMYKRDEDGIVLVNQDRCRSWRFCMSGCPYKKVYFNWKTHKAEKCTLCYPRIEEGLPTVCSETCVGRIRYLGVVLYDADKVKEVAEETDEKKLYERQLELFLDPFDPAIQKAALEQGIDQETLDFAQRSPIYQLAVKERLAFPLHPEYRTLPMVWYVPPLSPIMNVFEGKESVGEAEAIFPGIDEMRIPVQYLANMLTAGDPQPVKAALYKLAMMRLYMRGKNTERPLAEETLAQVGLDPQRVEKLYRLLAIAKYEDRFVLPKAHREQVLADPELAHGTVGYEGCPGCGSGGHRAEPIVTEAQKGKSGAEIYAENFYGGIWRD